MTRDDILLILYNDAWFRHSKSIDTVTIIGTDLRPIEVPKSYYHTYSTGEQIWIRVSDHGTTLNTWLKRRKDPSLSLQNLSVVFSDKPVTSKVETEPITTIDAGGKEKTAHKYFVVEQYVYRMDKMSVKDFKKFVNKIKSLDNDNVFRDPFKKKLTKRASRTVLMPNDKDGTPIPSSTNPVHPRQTVVANNPDFEVDAKGNIIKDSRLRDSTMLEMVIRRMVAEEICKLLLSY